MRSRVLTVAVLALLIGAPPALGAFPYARPGANTADYSDLYASPGQTPADLEGKETWMYAATADDPASAPNPVAAAQIAAINANPAELKGVRGAHIVDADATAQTAWRVTTGRPDVVISVLDSGSSGTTPAR